MALPRWNVFRDPVTTPCSIRSTMASTNISVWMPSSRCDPRLRATAFGTPPIPSWMVAPWGIIPAIRSPMT